MDEDDLIQLRVIDVKVAVPAGNGVEGGLVVLEEDPEPHRLLQIIIGQHEARAIHVPWSNTVPPRPSTWDLFVSTLALLDARLERVVISDVEELRHFFAELHLCPSGSDVPLIVPARPSDALALGLRIYGCHVYAHHHVLDTAARLADGSRWVRPPLGFGRVETDPGPGLTGTTEVEPAIHDEMAGDEQPTLTRAADPTVAAPATAKAAPAGKKSKRTEKAKPAGKKVGDKKTKKVKAKGGKAAKARMGAELDWPTATVDPIDMPVPIDVPESDDTTGPEDTIEPAEAAGPTEATEPTEPGA